MARVNRCETPRCVSAQSKPTLCVEYSFADLNNVVAMIWKKVKAIAPLYVIGALDEKTAQEVEASFDDGTPQQWRVIARWREVATLLPQALPLQTPADYVRERLLSRIAEESQRTPIEIAVEESASKEMADRGENKILP